MWFFEFFYTWGFQFSPLIHASRNSRQASGSFICIRLMSGLTLRCICLTVLVDGRGNCQENIYRGEWGRGRQKLLDWRTCGQALFAIFTKKQKLSSIRPLERCKLAYSHFYTSAIHLIWRFTTSSIKLRCEVEYFGVVPRARRTIPHNFTPPSID